MKLGVCASGEGSTLQAVIDACESGDMDSEVKVVVSNKKGSKALHRARISEIPTVHISKKTHPDLYDRDIAMLNALVQHDVEVVLLAGYLKKIGPNTLNRYKGRVLNTHPSLLPKYGGEGMYGMNVHRAVLEAGETESGVSIHVVDDEYDTGPVIAQSRVPVNADDTVESLAQRVHERELVFLVDTLAKVRLDALSRLRTG